FYIYTIFFIFFFSSRRRHTRSLRDWSSDVCSSDLFGNIENMVVTLYTQKQFFNITEAPSWAGGVNDGKLRIPIQGVTSMTPELRSEERRVGKEGRAWRGKAQCINKWIDERVSCQMV